MMEVPLGLFYSKLKNSQTPAIKTANCVPPPGSAEGLPVMPCRRCGLPVGSGCHIACGVTRDVGMRTAVKSLISVLPQRGDANPALAEH